MAIFGGGGRDGDSGGVGGGAVITTVRVVGDRSVYIKYVGGEDSRCS